MASVQTSNIRRISTLIGEPTTAHTEYVEPKIKSFFQGKTYGRTLYNEVLLRRPKKVVEFGNAYGFTTVVIANALEALGQGHLTSYDHGYRPRKLVNLYWNVWRYAPRGRVSLRFGDLFKWLANPEPFDLLYVDCHNDGAIVAKLPRIAHMGTILFEGGSLARDEHMGTLRPHIKGSADYTIIDPHFPSLSRID